MSVDSTQSAPNVNERELRTLAHKLRAKGRLEDAESVLKAAETWVGREPPPLTDADHFTTLAGELIGADYDAFDYGPFGPEYQQALANHDRGGLSDAHEQAVCAAVCCNTRGMDAETWKGLNLTQRLPWVREAFANTGGQSLPASEPGRESLSAKEYGVLCVLKKEFPCCVLLPDLAAKSDIARKTCGSIVNSLIERGLAERRSERKGVTITSEGKKLLAINRPLNAP